MAETAQISTLLEELPEVQQKAVLALLESPTITAAAKKAGIGRRTLYTYLSDPIFKSVLATEQQQIAAAAARGLLQLNEKAVKVMADILAGKEMTALQLRAAVAVLELTPKLRDDANLEERLLEIERWRNERGN